MGLFSTPFNHFVLETSDFRLVRSPGLLAIAERRVHGGSFVSGSASAPGLDGSTLAQGMIIVIVIQYR